MHSPALKHVPLRLHRWPLQLQHQRLRHHRRHVTDWLESSGPQLASRHFPRATLRRVYEGKEAALLESSTQTSARHRLQ
jgi:hypothetical protein